MAQELKSLKSKFWGLREAVQGRTVYGAMPPKFDIIKDAPDQPTAQTAGDTNETIEHYRPHCLDAMAERDKLKIERDHHIKRIKELYQWFDDVRLRPSAFDAKNPGATLPGSLNWAFERLQAGDTVYRTDQPDAPKWSLRTGIGQPPITEDNKRALTWAVWEIGSDGHYDLLEENRALQAAVEKLTDTLLNRDTRIISITAHRDAATAKLAALIEDLEWLNCEHEKSFRIPPGPMSVSEVNDLVRSFLDKLEIEGLSLPGYQWI